MIILNFTNIDPETCQLYPDPRIWTDMLWYSNFWGRVEFFVNGLDFSMQVPVLGFARELNEIVYNLQNKSGNTTYSDPDHGHSYRLEFYLNAGFVSIQRVLFKDSALEYTTEVTLEEFSHAAQDFQTRVVDHCSRFAPELLTDENIQDWLTNFSIPSYRHQLVEIEDDLKDCT